MRNALGPLLAALLLAGCEDNKLLTPPAAQPPPTAPAPAPAPASPAPVAPKPAHGATGVGDTAPVTELAPPKPPPSGWGQKSGADAGPATDGGGAPGPRGPRPGDSQGPLKP